MLEDRLVLSHVVADLSGTTLALTVVPDNSGDTATANLSLETDQGGQIEYHLDGQAYTPDFVDGSGATFQVSVGPVTEIDIAGLTGSLHFDGFTGSSGNLAIEGDGSLAVTGDLTVPDGDLAIGSGQQDLSVSGDFTAGGGDLLFGYTIYTVAGEVPTGADTVSLSGNFASQGGNILVNGSTIDVIGSVDASAGGGQLSMDAGGAVSIQAGLALNGRDLSIDGGGTVSIDGDVATNGGDLSVTGQTIDVGDTTGVTVSTTNGGDAGTPVIGLPGSVDFQAYTITIGTEADGVAPSMLDAGSGGVAAPITLQAQAAESVKFGGYESGEVDVNNATIQGGTVTIEVKSVVTVSFDSGDAASTDPSVWDEFTDVLTGFVNPPDFGYANDTTDAGVTLADGAVIDAATDVSITSDAESNANFFGLGGQALIALSLTTSTANIEAESGSVVEAGGNVTIATTTANNQSVSGVEFGPLDTYAPVDIVVAVAKANSTATTTVDTGRGSPPADTSRSPRSTIKTSTSRSRAAAAPTSSGPGWSTPT